MSHAKGVTRSNGRTGTSAHDDCVVIDDDSDREEYGIHWTGTFSGATDPKRKRTSEGVEGVECNGSHNTSKRACTGQGTGTSASGQTPPECFVGETVSDPNDADIKYIATVPGADAKDASNGHFNLGGKKKKRSVRVVGVHYFPEGDVRLFLLGCASGCLCGLQVGLCMWGTTRTTNHLHRSVCSNASSRLRLCFAPTASLHRIS
jgi:hypothetical protein